MILGSKMRRLKGRNRSNNKKKFVGGETKALQDMGCEDQRHQDVAWNLLEGDLIGVSVEIRHLKNWSTPRSIYLIIPQGLFSTIKVFGLAITFLAVGLCLTALRVQKICTELGTYEKVGVGYLCSVCISTYITQTQINQSIAY